MSGPRQREAGARASWSAGVRLIFAVSLVLLSWPGAVAAGTARSAAPEESRTTLEAVRSAAHTQRAALERMVRAELQRIEQGLVHLEAESRRASADARRELQRAIEELEDKQARAVRRLKDLPRASAAAWADVRAAMAEALEDLDATLSRAAARLRE